MASPIIFEAVCVVCGSHTGYSHGGRVDGFVCSKCTLLKASIPSKAVPAKQEPAPKAIALVRDFTPKGRSGLYIYAVVIKQHPDKVKIGMTRRWVNRQKSYANWDLSPGDAILGERVFCINEDFVDLEKLESHILRSFNAPLAFGSEWFASDLDTAARHIDRIMCANDISYEM